LELGSISIRQRLIDIHKPHSAIWLLISKSADAVLEMPLEIKAILSGRDSFDPIGYGLHSQNGNVYPTPYWVVTRTRTKRLVGEAESSVTVTRSRVGSPLMLATLSVAELSTPQVVRALENSTA